MLDLQNLENLNVLIDFFQKNKIHFGEDYEIQLVPVFTPGSMTCRYRYIYDPNWEWESLGRFTVKTESWGSHYDIELWHRKGKKIKAEIE